MVDGRIVLEESSLQVVAGAEAVQAAAAERVVVEEGPPALNYASYGRRTPTEHWSKRETELFHQAIKYFGNAPSAPWVMM